MTPQELVQWAFALMIVSITITVSIIVGYIAFKVLCVVKEKGVQVITSWLFEKSDYQELSSECLQQTELKFKHLLLEKQVGYI